MSPKPPPLEGHPHTWFSSATASSTLPLLICRVGTGRGW